MPVNSVFSTCTRDGPLRTFLRGGARAYYGVSVAGFPNLFILVGPNTGLGHNSIVFMIEAQARLIRQCLELLRRKGATSIEVRQAVQKRFNEKLQKRFQKTVWQSGCASWYLDENGKNTTIWPGFTAEYWLKTHRLRPRDYRLS